MEVGGAAAALKLPRPLDGHAIAAIGHLLFVFGGDFNEGKDSPPGVGKMLHVVDTRNISAGWRRLSDSPGQSKSCMVFSPVGGKLFVLGSSSDSWEYTPASDSWARLPDMPLPNPVKYSGSAAFMDRYILAIGGAANFKATGINGSFPYPARPMFMPRNATCNCTADSNPNNPGINYWGYNNAVLVYDTVGKKWGTVEYTPARRSPTCSARTECAQEALPVERVLAASLGARQQGGGGGRRGGQPRDPRAHVRAPLRPGGARDDKPAVSPSMVAPMCTNETVLCVSCDSC